MPAGGSSYLPAMSHGRRSFAYHKLKKLPPASPTSAAFEQQDHHQQQQQSPLPSAAAIQESYQSYYRALGAAVARGRRRQWQQERRRVRPRRLRISALARALRRRAAAVGGRVRAAAAKVARRLREGRPYIGDLFAGNYMFMQVAPSPTMVAGGVDDKSFVPFAEYYYAKVGKGMIRPVAPSAAAGALQVHHHPAAAAVMYKV